MRELDRLVPNAAPQQMEITDDELFPVRLQPRTGAAEMTDYERVPIEMARQNPLIFWRENEKV